MKIIMNHKELVLKASKWLKSIGCTVIIEELTTVCSETPDSIGWRDSLSILVECKTSKHDFLADKNKIFRMPYGKKYALGDWRFYMCPPGIINPCDLIGSEWGLLYVESIDKRAKRIIAPKGNTNWHPAPFKGNKKEENKLLVSALRRISAGRIFRNGMIIN